MSSEFIAEIAPWWRKLRVLKRQSLAMCSMIPVELDGMPRYELVSDPVVKQQIKNEYHDVIMEMVGVEKAVADIVARHRDWLEGRYFAIRHEKRWKFDQRELCKIVSVDGKGRAKIVKAWKGTPAWADEEVFSAYSGGAWDFHGAMDECGEAEFAGLIDGIRSLLPSMIPESRHVNTTMECFTIAGMIRESMGVLDFKDLTPTFDLMNKADKFMIDNIDKFVGRCYVDTQSGTSYAIIGAGWDDFFKKQYIKSINVDEPSIDNFFLDTPTRLLDVGRFQISPFTRVRQVPRGEFLATALSVIDA